MTDGQRLFNRQVRVVVSGMDGKGVGWSSPLHIEATVTKTKGSKPNKATIQIYNLKEDSRNLILADTTKLVLLYAGYGASIEDAPLIFKGEIAPKDTVIGRSGVDIVATLEARDGLAAYQGGIISEAWPPGVTTVTILTRVAGAMGFGMGLLPADMPTVRYANGYSFVGPGRDALNSVLQSLGAEWSIQDGVLQILMADTPKKVQAFKVGAGTGLVGTPKKGKKGDVEFTAQLNAAFAPGRLVYLDSEYMPKNFILPTKVTHKINSDKGEFVSNIVGKIVGGPKQGKQKGKPSDDPASRQPSDTDVLTEDIYDDLVPRGCISLMDGGCPIPVGN